jgi:hypothetical protein
LPLTRPALQVRLQRKDTSKAETIAERQSFSKDTSAFLQAIHRVLEVQVLVSVLVGVPV